MPSRLLTPDSTISKASTLPLMLGFLLCMAACSSSLQPNKTKTEVAAPKPIQLDTGRVAFQRLYVTARGWAADAQPVSLVSQALPAASGSDGKAAIWRATFLSPGKQRLKLYTWSGIAAKDEPERGVTPEPDDIFSSSNQTTRPFEMAFLKTDSDKAFEIAQQHGGKSLLVNDPQMPVIYSLGWTPANQKLVWQVSYGGTEAKLMVAVDATTAVFVRAEK